LCFVCISIESAELKCEYKFEDWNTVGSLYDCFAINHENLVTDNSNRHVNSISGSHLASKSDNDIKGLWIKSSNVAYFPLGVDNFFPNLEAISISNSNLRRITKEDLKPYPNLRYFSIWSNKLQTVEKDLFQFNSKLEVIIFIDNQISHIDPNVFNNFVGKLRHLYLSGNICQFGDVADDKQKVNEMIAQIQNGNCKNEGIQLVNESKFLEKIDELQKIIEGLTLKIEADLLAQKKLTEKLNAQTKNDLQNIQESVFQLNGTCQCDKFEKRIKFIESAMGIDVHSLP
jgi:Leucine rich repeat